MTPASHQPFAFSLHASARNAPMLGAAEEAELARQAQAGSERALEQLVRAHLRLVCSMAREMSRHGPIEELEGEGMIGLVEAARRFDPERGVRFAGYAAHWIRAYMRKYTLLNRRIVRMPSSRNGRKLLANLRRTQRELTQALGRRPDNDTVATRLGVPVRDIEEVEAALSGRDLPTGHGGFGQGHEPISEGASPEAIVAEAEERETSMRVIKRALRTLTSRERAIVERRFFDEESPTLASIGRRLGISRERVRQLEQSAQTKLRVAVMASV